MTEENLLNHIIMRLSPKVMDYVEVRNPTTKAQLLQLVEKERDEGVLETDGFDGEGSRAEQVETGGSKGLVREETSKEKQWRGKRMRSEGSTESCNNRESWHQSKRRLPERRNWRKRSAPSLVEITEVKRRPHESCKWRKRPIPVLLPSETRKMTRREAADESGVLSRRSSLCPSRGADVENKVLSGRSSRGLPRGAADNDRQVLTGRSISPTQQIAHQREASGNRKDKSIPDKSRRSRNSEEQE
ncbi:hypothetical protein NPIL_180231 [Nephila pilipes]|uniref:Uncharacterized protein n=1 Tax=Nephila pilipes TaxID=299642 RepID=A0A8X6THQ4_NEPPI|nr:hypothetical protein NPIL_180231 [Nephila pilipes]